MAKRQEDAIMAVIHAVAQCGCGCRLVISSPEQVLIDLVLLEAQKREYDRRQEFWKLYDALSAQIDQMIDEWKIYCQKRRLGNIYVTHSLADKWAEANGYGELLKVERQAHYMRNDDILYYAPVLYVLCPICGSRAYIGGTNTSPQVPFSVLDEATGGNGHATNR